VAVGVLLYRFVARSFLIACLFALVIRSAISAAEINSGVLTGVVTDAAGSPLANVAIAASAPSARYKAKTDARGQYVIVGVSPDTYTISAELPGFESGVESGVTVIANQSLQVSFKLVKALRTIATVSATSKAFNVGSTSDSFAVTGAGAQARSPVSVASGLSTFSAGTVQGSASNAPGIEFDDLGNISTRGSKVDDTVFTYDSVPIPQGLVVNPGGNFVGAQTPTTGVGETSVTLDGYGNQSDNALGGIINEIPLTGTYPAREEVELGLGSGARFELASFQFQTATADLRSRLAVSSRFSSEQISFGDGVSFYPGEASVVGIGLQARGQFSVAVNYHYAVTSKDDVALTVFNGAASYDQYGSPFPGQTYGLLDGTEPSGAAIPFPGVTSQNEPVTSPARTRGFFDVLKGEWTHTGEHSLERVQIYQSFFGALANGPFWDDNAYGQGAISLVSDNTGHTTGLQFDATDTNLRNTFGYGFEHRIDNSDLDEFVPTNDEYAHSNPTLQTNLGYLGDTWQATNRLTLTGTGRLFTTHVIPDIGYSYDVGALDPHVSASYRLGRVYALRATFDHNTVAPKALETDLTDTTNVLPNGAPAPFVPLAPERGNDFTYSFEGGGRAQFRFTYFQKFEKDRIDSIPPDLHEAVENGVTPSSVGVPGNVGNLRASGFEVYVKNGPLTLNANIVRAFSSSGSEFSYNGLNTAALQVGHLFPVSYLPDLGATLAYEFTPVPHLRISPELSFESGYPYGVGEKIWVHQGSNAVLVNNDNNVNPGANYYFLRNPALPFNASTNPYVATLGGPEGADPNSLRTPPQTLLNLHVEGDLSKRVSVVVDVTNFLGDFSPTQLVSNPYLVGPPGYQGGNPVWAAWYGKSAGYSNPYTLGNGVPTNDGVHRILPWSFGTAGYVGESWANARDIQIRLRYQI
jgi:hypothetical protein